MHPAVHEVYVGGDLVGTFSGEVPRAGEVIRKELLRPPVHQVKGDPRHTPGLYLVEFVAWSLTDEAQPLRAQVTVRRIESASGELNLAEATAPLRHLTRGELRDELLRLKSEISAL